MSGGGGSGKLEASAPPWAAPRHKSVPGTKARARSAHVGLSAHARLARALTRRALRSLLSMAFVSRTLPRRRIS
jgi:hypothetical protein